MQESPAKRFTALELATINWILEKFPTDRSALEAQLRTAVITSRKNTGIGFFTYFSVDEAADTRINLPRLRNGPLVQLECLEHEMGLLLWVNDGYADCIEGFTYSAEDTTNISFDQVAFKLCRPQGGERAP